MACSTETGTKESEEEWRGQDVIVIGGDDETGPLLEHSSKPTQIENLRLLDKALEEIGTGKYQKKLLLLAMFSIFVDVSERALTSLLYVEFNKEWHVPPRKMAIVGSLSAVGTMGGSLFFGWFSDRYGRTTAFRFTLISSTLIGLLSSFAPSVMLYALTRLFLGFMSAGNILVCSALLIESVPSSERGRYVAITGFSWGIAHFVMDALAWIVFPLAGWRWMMRITAMVFIPVVLFVKFVEESPRFHVEKGDLVSAVSTVKIIASSNGKQCPDFFCEDNLYRHSKKPDYAPAKSCTSCNMLCTRRHLVLILPLVLVWFCNQFGMGAYGFLPFELKKYLGGDQIHFITALVMSASGIFGTFVNIYFVQRLPRLMILRVGLVATTLFTLCLNIGKHPLPLFAAVFLMHAGSCISTSILYLYTPEVFPTSIRITALGVCLTFTRAADITSPFVVAAVAEVSLFWYSIVFASFFVLALIGTLFLRLETFNKLLFEDGEDTIGAQGGQVKSYKTPKPEVENRKEIVEEDYGDICEL